jgi:hypothetical protein
MPYLSEIPKFVLDEKPVKKPVWYYSNYTNIIRITGSQNLDFRHIVSLVNHEFTHWIINKISESIEDVHLNFLYDHWWRKNRWFTIIPPNKQAHKTIKPRTFA